MLFCQAWIAIMATRSNLAIPQTFPLEKPCGSNIGLMCYLVFWMSLYKDYLPPVRNTHEFLGSVLSLELSSIKCTPKLSYTQEQRLMYLLGLLLVDSKTTIQLPDV